MDEEEISSTSEVSTELVNENDSHYVGAETDDVLRMVGGIIVVCSLLLVFGGETFAWWEVETQIRNEETTIGFTFKLGITEFYAEGYQGEKETNAYSDTECNCEGLESLFTNLRIMLLGLICCAGLLAYIGHTGEKKHLVPKLLVGICIISLLTSVYAFYSIPKVYDDETEFFKDIGEDPLFYGNIETELSGNEVDVSVAPSLGFFLPVAALILSIYLIKVREISFKDITG